MLTGSNEILKSPCLRQKFRTGMTSHQNDHVMASIGLYGCYRYLVDLPRPVWYDEHMTAEQEAFERGFLRGFQEGRKIDKPYVNPNQTPFPTPPIIGEGGVVRPGIVRSDILDCYNADRLRND